MKLGIQVRDAGMVKLGRNVIRFQVGRPAMHAVGVQYRKDFLPDKYKRGARRKYDLAPRSGERGSGRPYPGSYTERKVKEKDHSRPLEWSGESRQRTLSDKTVRAIAKSFQSYRAELPINAPAYNLRNPNSTIDMRAEIERVANVEIPPLERTFAREWDRNLTIAAANNRKTVTLAA